MEIVRMNYKELFDIAVRGGGYRAVIIDVDTSTFYEGTFSLFCAGGAQTYVLSAVGKPLSFDQVRDLAKKALNEDPICSEKYTSISADNWKEIVGLM